MAKVNKCRNSSSNVNKSVQYRVLPTILPLLLAATPSLSAAAPLLLFATMSAADLQRPASRVRAIFSDLDGTIVHFPAWFEEHGIKIVSRDAQAKRAVVESPTGEQRVCRLLPSSTMGDGLVSERTVELIAELRARGVIFVIVTAARKSTLFEREPLLPPSDAYVCETGSRIYRGGLDALDEAWAKGFEEVSGPLERELDVSERPEPLWQLFRRFQAEVPGLKCDARSYYGCFRVDTQGNTAVEAALRACIEAHLPHGITWAMNLGKYDFFPSASGKGNAVAYLQAVYGVRADESCCLFDDDNDLPMAERCAVHYLPGLTSQSVSRAAAEHPEWHVASKAGQGVFAIEECLEQLLERVVREQEGGTVDVGGGGGSGVAAPTASKGPEAAISS